MEEAQTGHPVGFPGVVPDRVDGEVVMVAQTKEGHSAESIHPSHNGEAQDIVVELFGPVEIAHVDDRVTKSLYWHVVLLTAAPGKGTGSREQHSTSSVSC